MKRSVRTTILTLAIVSLIMVCMTTFSYAGGFGIGPDMPENINTVNTLEGVNLTWEKSPESDGYKVYRRLPEQRHSVEIAEIVGADKTFFNDETAESGKRYEYSVRAYKGIFLSRLSERKELVRLSQSTIEKVTLGDGCIELNWEKSDGAEGYYVYKKTAQGIEFLGNVRGDNNCFYEDKDVSERKSYTYTVTAYSGESRSSHEYKTSPIFVGTPKITSVENTGKSISVKWQKPKFADSFVIYRKGNNDTQWVKLKVLSSEADTFIDSDVKSGEIYTYTVRAISQKNYSGYNKSGVSLQCLNIPGNFSVGNYNDGISLSWDAVEGAESYNVYRTYDKTTEIIGQTSSTAYSDMNVEEGKTYTYSIKAVGFKSDMLSDSTENISCCVLKKPLNIAAVNMFDGIQLYWEKSNSATGYIIYRKNFGETEWTKIRTVNSRNTNYIIDHDVQKDSMYVYTVQCVKNGVLGSFDVNGVSIRHIPSLGIKATLCPQGIKLQWSEIRNSSGYELFRKTDDDADWVKIGSIDASQTACIDGNPIYGKKNNYVVRVVFSDGGFADSTVSSAFGIDPNKPMVALTYDDGPSTEVTNRILDKLAQYNARATFFVVGERVNKYSDCLKRAVSQHCEIGNHSYHHKDLSKSTAEEIKQEIISTNTAVENITGVYPVVARAPGGAVNDLARENVGMPFIFWSIDTLDWKYRNAESVTEKVKSQVKDGSIVLMHDLYNSTADASDILIPWLTEKGYQLVTVSEMMAVKGIEMKDGETYISGY